MQESEYTVGECYIRPRNFYLAQMRAGEIELDVEDCSLYLPVNAEGYFIHTAMYNLTHELPIAQNVYVAEEDKIHVGPIFTRHVNFARAVKCEEHVIYTPYYSPFIIFKHPWNYDALERCGVPRELMSEISQQYIRRKTMKIK
jgi:hypothetical protein